jgi:hypothetical protein
MRRLRRSPLAAQPWLARLEHTRPPTPLPHLGMSRSDLQTGPQPWQARLTPPRPAETVEASDFDIIDVGAAAEELVAALLAEAPRPPSPSWMLVQGVTRRVVTLLSGLDPSEREQVFGLVRRGLARLDAQSS